MALDERFVVGDRITVKKRPNVSNYWYAAYRDNAGRQRLPSLKTTNKREASQRAHQILAALSDDTHEVHQQVKANKAKTFKDAVASYVAIEGPSKAESGFKQVKNRLARLCGEAKIKPAHISWADVPVQAIDDTMIENWIQIERGRNRWSDKTAKHYLNDITQVLEHAKKQKWVTRNKSRDVAKIEVRNEEIPEILADDLVEPLFAALPEHVRIVMGILLDTGLRLSELHSLCWQDVNTTGRSCFLTVRNRHAKRTKSGKFRLVPLIPSAADTFDQLRPGATWNLSDTPNRLRSGATKLTAPQRAAFINTIAGQPCSCFMEDNRLRGANGGQKGYCEACERLFATLGITRAHARKMWRDRDKDPCELVWPSDEDPNNYVIPKFEFRKSLDGAARQVGIPRFRAHQMRHTWASRLIKTMNHYELMEIGGWSDVDMVRRYARLDNLHLITKVTDVLEPLPGLRPHRTRNLRIA